MAEINIYQNPGQSLANIYKGFARQCNPGFVFPEAQTIEAWDIPLKLHPEFVPGGDISKADQQYSTLLAQELANGVTIGFRMVNEKERVCNVEILPLLTSMAQNLDRIKARFGSGYLDRFKGSPNVYPTDVGLSPDASGRLRTPPDASGGISQESGLLVSYGVNLRTLAPSTWQAMTLPEDIKTLVGPGVGLRLDAPNFSDVFNTIKSGLRYTTAVALLLAYFAAI
ncbi:TPA: DUF3218 family protein [Pseudomonas aeruginosa]